jgi:transcriptional regulator with XRE-family HTH domain
MTRILTGILAFLKSTAYHLGMGIKHRRLSDQVRDAVNASGLSHYAICKALELSQGTFSRFMSGRSGISMKNLDQLGELLDLEVRPKSKTKGK